MECKNCNSNVPDDFAYCPYCGQRTNVSRLNFKQSVQDIWVAFSNADKGVMLLIKELVYKPGSVARDYIAGRRRTYLNPFSYLAIMVAIALYFILRFENVGLDYSQMGADDAEMLRFSFKYFNLFILLMCPIYAFAIWISFWGNRYNYLENLALSAYLSGQTMLFYVLALILFVIFPSTMNVLGVFIGFLITIWYVIAILQFYQKRDFWSIVKSVLIIITTQIISQSLVLFAFSLNES